MRLMCHVHCTYAMCPLNLGLMAAMVSGCLLAHVACDDDSCDSNAARTLGGCPGSVAAVAFASSAWDSWQLTCRETLQDLHD